MSRLRSLGHRVKILSGGREPDEVVQALHVLGRSGTVPPGPAGVRAQELWEEAGRRGCMDEVRLVWCVCKATGKTLADLVQESAGAEGDGQEGEEP